MWLRQRGRGQTGVSTVCWSTTAGVLSVSFSSKLYLRASAWNVGHCLFHSVHYPHQHTVVTPVCQTIVMAVGIICMFTHTWNNKVVSWEHFHCSLQLLEPPLVFSSGMLSFCSFQRLVHAVLLERDSVQRPCLFVCLFVLQSCIEMFGGNSQLGPLDRILLSAFEFDVCAVIKQSR